MLSKIPRVASAAGALLLTCVAGLGVYFERASQLPLTSQTAPSLWIWCFFGGAGALLAFALSPASSFVTSLVWRDQPGAPGDSDGGSRPKSSPRGSYRLLRNLSLLAALLSMPLFSVLSRNFEDPSIAANWLANDLSWYLWLLSIVLLAVAYIVNEHKANGPHPPKQENGEEPVAISQLNMDPEAWNVEGRLPVRIELALVVGLTMCAGILRLWNLEGVAQGIWFDESQNGSVSQGLLESGSIHAPFITGFTQMGALPFYLMGIIQGIFGSGIWQIRLLPAISGTLLVPLLYLLASRLYGWRVGLCAAGFLAVSTWNITLSRFGVASMFTVALDVGCYVLVVQGLRTGRAGYYAAAGVMAGLALQAYYVGRLVPVVLAVLLVHILLTQPTKPKVRGLAQKTNEIKSAFHIGIGHFVLGALVGVIPVLTFAVSHPDIYNGRVNEVSIFSAAGSDGHSDALALNLQKHVLMFNWLGDMNARHNVPGNPMLDPVVAALFWSGLAFALFRIRRWQYFFPVLWFAASMAGGVFSSLVEGPNGHRTMESTVVTALLAGLFLGGLLEVASSWFNKRKESLAEVADPGQGRSRGILRGVQIAAILVVVALSAAQSVPKYFSDWANNTEAALRMQAPALRAVHDVVLYGREQGYRVYLDKEYDWSGQPFAFLGARKEYDAAVPWDGLYALPITGTVGANVALVMSTASSADADYIKSIYPNAQLVPLLSRDGENTTLMITALIPSSDIEAAISAPPGNLQHGLTGLYRQGSDFNGAPVFERRDPVISFDFGRTPLPYPYTVEWSGEIFAPVTGAYSFALRQYGRSELSIDGLPVLVGTGRGVLSSTSLELTGGWHSIGLRFTPLEGGHQIFLYWTTPGGKQVIVPSANLRPK